MKTKFWILAICFFCIGVSCNNKPKETTPASENKPATDNGISQPSVADIPANMYINVDMSPMDMSYFPVDYPKLKMANSATPPPVARVIYSRPHLDNRHLFQTLLKHDEPWRLGANEATEIDFYRPVTIQGQKIPAGRYIIYAIPHTETWTIAINTNIDSWGLQQDPAKDIGRFEVPITTVNYSQEYFTLLFEKTDKGADLVISWDNLLVKLPIEF
jgi:hypothetical protein